MPEGAPLSITIHIHHQVPLNNLLHVQGRKIRGWDSWWRVQVGNEHTPRSQELSFCLFCYRLEKQLTQKYLMSNCDSRACLRTWFCGLLLQGGGSSPFPKCPSSHNWWQSTTQAAPMGQPRSPTGQTPNCFTRNHRKETALVSLRQRWITSILRKVTEHTHTEVCAHAHTLSLSLSFLLTLLSI